jgi:hypothetical protein
MCDIILTAGDYSVPVHKVVLAASSDYFAAMFSGYWTEQQERNITLHELTPVGLKAVIEFSYNGVLTVDPENLEDILSAIHHCQLVKAYKSCEEYLKGAINYSNFGNLLRLTDNFKLDDLQNELVKFAEKLLLSYIGDESSILDEVESRCLKQILQKWKFSKCGWGQMAAFDLVFKWVIRNRKECDLWELLMAVNRSDCDIDEAVKFCRLTPEERIHQASSVGKHLLCCQYVFHLNKSFENRLFTLEFIAYDDEGKLWKELPTCPMTNSWIYTNGMAVLNGALYICGGSFNESTTKMCCKYEPWLDRWGEIQPMQEARERFPLVAFQNKLYALGGLQENEPCAAVEMYNPLTNQWNMLLPCMGGRCTSVEVVETPKRSTPMPPRHYFAMTPA